MQAVRQAVARRRRRPRHGSLTVELLLILPVLLLLAVAVVQVCLVFAAIERLTHASHVGARVASQGGSKEDVEEAVRCALGHGRFRKAEILICPCNCGHEHGDDDDDGDDHHHRHHGDDRDDRMSSLAVASGRDDGDDDHDHHHRHHCCGKCVKVCVRIPAGCVVPGPLIIFGCKNECLVGCTIMRKE